VIEHLAKADGVIMMRHRGLPASCRTSSRKYRSEGSRAPFRSTLRPSKADSSSCMRENKVNPAGRYVLARTPQARRYRFPAESQGAGRNRIARACGCDGAGRTPASCGRGNSSMGCGIGSLPLAEKSKVIVPRSRRIVNFKKSPSARKPPWLLIAGTHSGRVGLTLAASP